MPEGLWSYTSTADGRVRVAIGGRVVTALAGTRAARFVARADDAKEHALQQLMARATGNFKHGNERS